VFVSAITHGEMLRYLRTEYAAEYDADTVAASLLDLGVEIIAVDEHVASTFAQQVCERWPTHPEWQQRKRSHCEDMLEEGRCSAAADWYIAATAAHHGLLLVTEDTGPEFDICEHVRFGDLAEQLGLGPDPEA
jgi:predicted nucleic acid-binding protein